MAFKGLSENALPLPTDSIPSTEFNLGEHRRVPLRMVSFHVNRLRQDVVGEIEPRLP